jgi:hypothetical protein
MRQPEVKELRRSLRAVVRDQKGLVLPTVLLLLVLGTLLIVPALDYGATSLKGTQVTEKKELELYAADSGVTDAVFWLQEDGETGGRWNWDDGDSVWKRDTYELNDRTVDVDIEELGGNTYKVTSEAVSAEGGSTTIESVVVLLYSDFGFVLDNAITSGGNVNIQPNTTVDGNILLPPDGDLDPPNYDPDNGEIIREDLEWPSGEQLIEIYWEQVKDLGPPSPYPDGHTINIPAGTTEAAPFEIGPLWAEGDLEIKGKGWARLEGTVYVKGALTFNPLDVETEGIRLCMNSESGESQSIFAEGYIDMRPGVTLSGSGCVVAVGDIFFNPQIAAGSEDDFILVMSAEGTVTINPTGAFYGSIVGNIEVGLQPHIDLNWTDPTGKGLNFPQGEGNAGDPGATVSVATYNIT